jgi:Rhodopirellula transposase DDE domain
VEQDRAPDVQLREPQLARQAAESLQVIINLIAATTTTTGLKVYAQIDDRTYEKGIEVSEQQLATVAITRHEFHGEWNYTITPAETKS